MADFYEILGVGRDASEEDIKRMLHQNPAELLYG